MAVAAANAMLENFIAVAVAAAAVFDYRFINRTVAQK
jgi:hypothetical protein